MITQLMITETDLELFKEAVSDNAMTLISDENIGDGFCRVIVSHISEYELFFLGKVLGTRLFAKELKQLREKI